MDGSDGAHTDYRIFDPQSTSHQLINIVTNSMASPATFIPEPSFKTIGVSLAFSGKSVPSNVLTSSTPNIRCSAPLDSFSASEVKDISVAYEAGNGGRSPDDVATVHLAILLDSILNEAQGAYTAEESQRVNLVLEKYKGLVRTFVLRKTDLMEAAMKFASDVSPLCTELTSALGNPIWGWRLRSKHRFSKFFVELESDVNLAEDAGMVAIDHCHVTRRVLRTSYSSEKTQKHLQTTLVSDSIVSLVISMGNNRYVSFRCFRLLLRLMRVISMGNNNHCVDMGLTFGGVDKPAEEGLMAKSIRKLFLPDDSM
jgi:hypothetical protein